VRIEGLNVKIDLQKMSYLELLELKGNIDRAIECKKVAEKSSIKKKVRELIEGAGFDVGDIVGGSSSKSLKGRKVAPKYRNPKNPEETWTGRGRQPKWLVAELGRGRSLNSFLIK
jgi:DNA-binding protein H-NS